MTEPLSDPLSQAAEWWMIPQRIWAGPKRWLKQYALPMRGPVAAGGGPVPVAQIPAGARTQEFEDDFIIPGLQDAHVHSGLIDLKEIRSRAISAALDLGGVPDRVATLRLESLDPDSGLPTLEIVGAFLTAPGGYPSDRSWAAPGSWREVHSAADAEAAVAEQVAVGASAIKVAINVEAGPVLAPPVLAALVAATHATGRRVIAHAQGAGAVQMALDGGVDVLAHTPWTERLEPGLLRDCAAQTTWISTLTIHPPGSPEEGTAYWNLDGFLGQGGLLRYGTDMGNGPVTPTIHTRETMLFQNLGLTVDDVLASMTGPMLGPAPGDKSVQSRFVAGVAPAVLHSPPRRNDRYVGYTLAQAEVFSNQCVDDEQVRWQKWHRYDRGEQ
jgi:hypothetical protein